ncbi:MAG: hypothetical protein LBF38_04235, partial [Deltaproteobacteria bacterium]|nr:hypothetical protein [Deltaproteobacteria bacterium]
MKNLKSLTFFLCLALSIPIFSLTPFILDDELNANSFAKTGAPPELAPWVPWVLYGQLNNFCPANPVNQNKECAWPIELKIDVDKNGGSFEGLWEIRAPSWVRLPGQVGAWPLEVTDEIGPLSPNQDGPYGLGPSFFVTEDGLSYQATGPGAPDRAPGPVGAPEGALAFGEGLEDSGTPIAVVGDYPRVRLSAGRHLIKGRFSWKAQPKTLTLPLGPVMDITVSGTKKAFPVLDDNDAAGTTSLWLDDKPAALSALTGGEGTGVSGQDLSQGEDQNQEQLRDQNNLRVQIDRLLVDTQPMTVVTRVRLTVSGIFREETIKQVLLPDTTPTLLTSPVPARLSSEGLRVQLSPGVHDLYIQGRINSDIESLGPVGSLYGPETWTFVQQPTLRQVEIDGAGQIDPTLVDLPWGSAYRWDLIKDDQGQRMALNLSSLPIYQLEPGDSLRFTVLRRGDPEPGPDLLELARTCWLDFDGVGLTCRDGLNVNMRRSSYLAVKPPFELGQVSINGVPQVISWQIDSEGNKIPGLQLRQGQVTLNADLRLEPFTGTLPASGWDQSLTSKELLFHYPPGYNLFYADGANVSDEYGYPTSWWDRWSNLDLFIVLAIALAMFKLFGPFWAILAAVTLGLSYHEYMAPRLVFLHVLGATALLSVLPSVGKANFAVRSWRFIASIFLIVVSIVFVIYQARVAIYPQLYPVYASKSSWVYPLTNRLASGHGAAATDSLADNDESYDRFVQDPVPFYDEGHDLFDQDPVPMAMDRSPSMESAPTLSQRSATQSLSRTKEVPLKQNSLIMVAPEAKAQNTLPRPDWVFRYLYVDFNSQVSKDQTVKLFFMGPKLSTFFCFLRILLMSYLVLAIISSRGALKFGGFLGKIMPKPQPPKTQDPQGSQALPSRGQASQAQTSQAPDSNAQAPNVSGAKNGPTKTAPALASLGRKFGALLGALLGGIMGTVMLALVFSQGARADTEKWSGYPSEETLRELRQRLLANEDETAIGLTNLAISVPRQGHLRIGLQIQAQNEVAVPLPDLDPMVFQPTAVALESGERLPLLATKDGTRFVLVPKGLQRVNFEGRLAEAESFQLAFKGKFLPQKVELIELADWYFVGLDQNDHPQGNSVVVFTDFLAKKPEDLGSGEKSGDNEASGESGVNAHPGPNGDPGGGGALADP